MYAYLKGKIMTILPTHLVIEVSGIGYECLTPNPYRFNHQLDQMITLHTQLVVREDAQLLYGFKDEEEKAMFNALNKVTGIGPKSALAILATSTPQEIIKAIESESESYLIKFPGIGKKTARQIILDLKGKLTITEESELFKEVNDTLLNEALLAFEALGYSKREITKIEKELKKKQFSTVDEYVKQGLQMFVS
ncbi:Holliday junction branch migration protein RuvA [Macrococcoides caseolyticum]|uniref:Holliday junction branch migration protein RuvA n=1 Tax=Macrococcoides caseolyticum TaxID=69966 RepID=UPI000C32E2A6|nr:Holliday junction branch migration protein RuvA [Macrococcus caseolyticus]PKE13358.1 Holliday junction branch migration protein RuvA [Macrococcus caseolyticus]PKE47821.1 Holliday junction branch migration protein RuvA [Macrococcus caseolyticus]PKF14768.1 Holliday junction branch migration protein RuvA [Macrococcus caseolyticus]QQB06288.1 Holliday junction branch migration protein RuvA [Macrococcus caseolyticus]TDM25785.1 Holliday junction branch migration protein RuvA [Macrococcus caseolyti